MVEMDRLPNHVTACLMYASQKSTFGAGLRRTLEIAVFLML